MSAPERREWAQGVLEQLEPHLAGVTHVVPLAGARYREFLCCELEARGYAVDVPMKGLGIGKQLQWFDRHRAEHA
jgi:hypothetical protein